MWSASMHLLHRLRSSELPPAEILKPYFPGNSKDSDTRQGGAGDSGGNRGSEVTWMFEYPPGGH